MSLYRPAGDWRLLSQRNEPASSGEVTNYANDRNEPASSSSFANDWNNRVQKQGRPSKLIKEPTFDPLDDGTSESEVELEILSDDESLDGEDADWLRASKRSKTGDSFSTSIDVSQPLPRLDYEDIPILFQGPDDAEKVNRYFVVERRTDAMPGEEKTAMGCTPAIEGFKVWRRGDYGCGLRSALDGCPHYDTNRGGYNRLLRISKRRNLPFEHLAQGTKTIDRGIHKLFLSNEDKFQTEIDDLDLEGIFKDSIVQQHATDPTKMRIAARNKRGNRGISLGYTGGHSLRKEAITGIAEPQIVVDTWRYIPVAKKFTELQRAMASEAGFELIDEALFPDRQYKWAQKIDEGVANELFSLLFLVHDDPKSLAFSDWLQKHVDSQNCPHWSFLGFAWKTFFYQPIGRYVTGVITANWKKSVSDLLRRSDVITQAAEYIIHQLVATPETVHYTHLPLPTNHSVEISLGDEALK